MFWTRLLSGIVLLVIALATFSFGNIFLAVPLWLQTVSDIRQGSGNDNAHGIVDEGFLHLLGVFCFYNSAVVHFWSSSF